MHNLYGSMNIIVDPVEINENKKLKVKEKSEGNILDLSEDLRRNINYREIKINGTIFIDIDLQNFFLEFISVINDGAIGPISKGIDIRKTICSDVDKISQYQQIFDLIRFYNRTAALIIYINIDDQNFGELSKYL